MLYEAITEWFVYSIQALTNLLSQYYENEGFSPIQIGIAVSVGRVMSLVANPFWFKMKTLFGLNKVITLVTLIPVISIWGIYLMPEFKGKLIFISISGFFLAVVMPLMEGKVVSSLMKKGLAFNPSRLIGSIGFSITAFIAGFLFLYVPKIGELLLLTYFLLHWNLIRYRQQAFRKLKLSTIPKYIPQEKKLLFCLIMVQRQLLFTIYQVFWLINFLQIKQ